MQLRKIATLGSFFLASLSIVSCTKEEQTANEVTGVAPETLDCNYFEEDRVLTDNPNAPIDYIVTCKAPVTKNLKIEPGVVIAFKNEAGLEITPDGSISAIGTAQKPILFTGMDKIAGSWRGIYIGSKDVKNNFTHCVISYGGGKEFNSNGDKGNMIIYAGGKTTVMHSTFAFSASHGLNMNYRSGMLGDFDHNIFSENKTPIYVRANHVDAIGKNNTFIKNINNYVQVGCGSAFEGEKGDKTWNNLPVPYRITSTDFGITNKITVPANGNLSIAPGTTIEFSTGTYVKVDDKASFRAVGTSKQKITFTGVDKAPGAWGGISYNFTSSVRNELAYVDFEYGADSQRKGAIYMWANPKLNVHDCTFKKLEGCAIRDYNNCFCNPNLTHANNKFVDSDDYCHD